VRRTLANVKQDRAWLLATRIAATVVAALLGVLIVTGIVLTFRYLPDVSGASSVYAGAAGFGHRSRLSARSIHQFSSALFLPAVGALAISSIGLFFVRRNRAPIALSFLAGVVALVATITGFLLPWDQIALGAVTVGGNVRGYTRILDHDHNVKYVLIGARSTSISTFARVYWLHALLLPLVIIGLLVALAFTTRRAARVRAAPVE
jgi:quinol-cytochrome oxidoreductase complex cytochrome b subunit